MTGSWNTRKGDVMGWISVEERLPTFNEEVWCHDKSEGVIVGTCNDIRGVRWKHVYGDDDGLGDDRLYKVTHWQPLLRPDPPTETREPYIAALEKLKSRQRCPTRSA